jgi:cation transport ATPase
MQMKMLLCDPLSVLEHETLINRTMRIARQNLFGALAWHVLTMPLAALGWVTPWLAALSMLLSSVAVLLNAGRIYRSRREEFGRALGALVHNQRLEF